MFSALCSFASGSSPQVCPVSSVDVFAAVTADLVGAPSVPAEGLRHTSLEAGLYYSPSVEEETEALRGFTVRVGDIRVA